MTDLFRACCEVLDRQLCPMHYEELTRSALMRLGIDASQVNMNRVKEDVREKLLLAGRLRTFYFSEKPHFCGAMREWFPSNQPSLFNIDQCNVKYKYQKIPIMPHLVEQAREEARLRLPHMLTKSQDGPLRRDGLIRGFIIETHVTDYFQRKWPEFYVNPDNHHLYQEWCDHDFKLRIENKTYKVDVMGPLWSGDFGTPRGGGKRPVFCHILAQREGPKIEIHGYVRGRFLKERMSAWKTKPFYQLVVWLNCHKFRLPYVALKAAANRAANSRL